jgi:hypothetical protein
MFRRGFIALLGGAMLFVLGTGAPVRAKGDCEVIVYWDADFGGESIRTGDDSQYVGNHWNDRISSIRVIAGVWQFYWDSNYLGAVMELGPGIYRYVGDRWNDQISSFRCLENRDLGDPNNIY